MAKLKYKLMCTLETKYKQWREWLFGDDEHAIDRQICLMIWDCAVFLSINESRRYLPLDSYGKPMGNSMVHGFINHCFFVTQSIAIRRLLDRNVSCGKKSVVSLHRLICDMEKCQRLLTRQKILEALKFPYDYRMEEDRILQRMANNQENGVRRMPPEYEGCKFSQDMHNFIDEMARVTPENRKPDNSIPVTLFEWLKYRLDRCRMICDYVDKYLAHSATLESRQAIEGDKITLGNIIDAHKIICETAHFIMLHFFYRSGGHFGVIPQFDQFEYFDEPLAKPDTIDKLHKFWEEYGKRVESWAKWDWKGEYNKTERQD